MATQEKEILINYIDELFIGQHEMLTFKISLYRKQNWILTEKLFLRSKLQGNGCVLRRIGIFTKLKSEYSVWMKKASRDFWNVHI